jgi:DNA-binding transcriptional MerR regulator
VNSDHRDEQVTIGDFARLARLTPKALRVYEREGLLLPVEVDALTGYRRYDPSQLAIARLIAMLRGTDMSLADIRLVLDDLAIEPNQATERLGAHLETLEQQHTSRRSLVRHIHALLRKEPEPMYTTSTRHVPAQRVMSIQRRLRAPETDPFVEEAKAAFRAALGDWKPTGPFTVIFHGIVDNESDGPIEAILGCPEDLLPTEVVGIRTEPAHDEAYTTITKAQWAYPAILAAYDAVASSPQAMARPGSRLSCREVYLAEPDNVSDDDLLCDIAFPLG